MQLFIPILAIIYSLLNLGRPRMQHQPVLQRKKYRN